jgi:hypothetical protein
MFKSLDIQESMEVVGSDGKHVGTVDHKERDDRIILSESGRPSSSHLDRLGGLRGPQGSPQQAVAEGDVGMAGGRVSLAEEALGAIARKAIERKTGARGLRSIMDSILLDTMFDLPSLEGVQEVMISRQVVEGTAPPLYVYADRSDHTGDASA